MIRLLMENGEKINVYGENGRYFICGKRQIRKSNPQIKEVEEVKEKTKTEKKD